MAKNFPWKKEFDSIIERCHSAGIFDKIMSENIGKVQLVKGTDSLGNLTVINLSHLYTPFFLMLLGILASILCFLGEILSHMRRNSITRLKDKRESVFIPSHVLEKAEYKFRRFSKNFHTTYSRQRVYE